MGTELKEIRSTLRFQQIHEHQAKRADGVLRTLTANGGMHIKRGVSRWFLGFAVAHGSKTSRNVAVRLGSVCSTYRRLCVCGKEREIESAESRRKSAIVGRTIWKPVK